MNEYKFRGKDIETKQWVYGSLVDVTHPKTNERHCFIYRNYSDQITASEAEVTPETVGRMFKVGDHEYYEGDIIDNGSVLVMNAGMLGYWKQIKGEAVFLSAYKYSKYSAIGNKWDNPEFITTEKA